MISQKQPHINQPEIIGLSTTFLPTVPQLFVKVDRDKVLKQGVDLAQVYQTLQTFMGGFFVNYFNRFGRQWQVYIEAEGDYRTNAKNIGQFYVRNGNNQMLPLDAITTVEERAGPEFTMRYNEYRSAQINGAAAPGYSSAQATKALEETFQQTMSTDMGYDYLGMSFQEKKAQDLLGQRAEQNRATPTQVALAWLLAQKPWNRSHPRTTKLITSKRCGVSAKRSLASREFALGIEALKRFVACEPLRRVHKCIFGNPRS
jgi:hypothetical protein